MRAPLSSFALWLAAAGLFAVCATPLQEIVSAGQAAQAPGQGRGGGGAAAGRGQTPVRDRAPAVGTGHISGTVVLGGSGTPVRRARVNLTGGDLRGSRSIVTDDQGSFAFDALPAGRFTLTISKPGYVTMTYGAKRPGRPGTPIQLAEGQRMDKVVIALPRGGVITGVVVDEHGEPSPGTVVRALRFVMQTGEKTLQQAGQDQTDDRGVYRIFQLQPGEYLVSAAPRNMNLGDIRQALSAQIQALAAQASDEGLAENLGGRGGGFGLARGRGQAGAGGGGGRGGRGADMLEQLQLQLAMVEDEQSLTYAPVYYPGTASPSAAVPVTLGVSEERSGVDFQLQLVPTARVSGVVVSPAGALPQGTQVALVPHDRAGVPNIPGQGTNLARVDQEGRFTFQNVTPGQYSLQARSVIRDATQAAPEGVRGRGGRGRGQGPIAEVLWAAAEVALGGQDVSDIVLTLQPGMTVTGRIMFDGISLPPAIDLQRARVALVPRGAQPLQTGQIPPAEIEPSGQFTIRGVVPGRYALTASLPGGVRGGQPAGAAGAANSWVLKSVIIGGRDVLDFPIEIEPNGDVTGASVIFTDRTQSLAGTIQDVAGRPTSDFTIIVFPAENRYWTPLSRRIVSSRPGTDGRFTFASLPAGDYRLTAVTDVEPGEWYDPAFLSQLVPVSIPVTIGEGERKVQDIRLAGGE